MPSEVVVIGGGAAGFFSAIQIAEKLPSAQVTLIEKSQKLLSKVLISGGGRCNLTHDCRDFKQLIKNYPRGQSFLKPLFKKFAVNETLDWFHRNGVATKSEADGRMFPLSNSSQSVADCLLKAAKRLNIQVQCGVAVKSVVKNANGFELHTNKGVLNASEVVVAVGGQSIRPCPDFLEGFDLQTIDPVPSLFTFNLPENPLVALAGVSVPEAEIWLSGFPIRRSGPVLITHWGLSGPATLWLSAFAARWLKEKNYEADVYVNWVNPLSEHDIREDFSEMEHRFAQRQMDNLPHWNLPKRLWEFLLVQSEISPQAKLGELSKKAKNKLIDRLVRSELKMSGKTTFKEEFVTAGGISDANFEPGSLECKHHPGLYFAGEVLDIDGVTGGFNFQAAWTTGWSVAEQILNRYRGS